MIKRTPSRRARHWTFASLGAFTLIGICHGAGWFSDLSTPLRVPWNSLLARAHAVQGAPQPAAAQQQRSTRAGVKAHRPATGQHAPRAHSPVAARSAAARPALAARGTATAPARIIRAGLRTKGAPIQMWSRAAMTVTDAMQPARRLAVRAGETVTFILGTPVQTRARGQRFSGPLSVRTSSGTYPAWQVARIAPSGSVTHISSNGGSPRYQRAYRGAFEVTRQGYSFEPAMHAGGLSLINIVSLEEYLKGVVPWEMNASAPLEALKAQAICARSETLAKIESGRHAPDGYDICDYDHCQGYAGTENEAARSSLAVEQTRGLAIYYGGKVADAVYGTNSGGITAAAEDVWRGPPEPYLRSVRDFPPGTATDRVVKSRMTEADWVRYCTTNLPSYAQPSSAQFRALAARRSSRPATAALFQSEDLPEFYRWTRVVEPHHLAAAVSRNVKMQVATEIRVLERAASGHIKRLQVVGLISTPTGARTGTATFEGDSQIRAMISGRLGSTTALPSSTFVVQARRDARGNVTAFVLRGAGWGHSVGMCQRGAQSRATRGWTAHQIINFYFTGVELRRIY